MDDARKKRPAEASSDAKEPERRRFGTIVHDERGNASVSWHDAPPDERRPVLEILGPRKLAVKNEDSHDPYARAGARGTHAAEKRPPRTDLRKLSEWIKMMRELEARKKNEGE